MGNKHFSEIRRPADRNARLELDRPRREATQDLATLLDEMSDTGEKENSLNDTLPFNKANETTTGSTVKPILKPSVVETEKLKQTLVVKPDSEKVEVSPKEKCVKSYCCYDRNNTNQNDTTPNVSFECPEQTTNRSSICKSVIAACQPLPGQVCQVNSTNLWCRINQVCGANKKPDCTLASIDTAIEASRTTTTTTALTSTMNTTAVPTTSPATSPSSSLVTTTATTPATTVQQQQVSFCQLY